MEPVPCPSCSVAELPRAARRAGFGYDLRPMISDRKSSHLTLAGLLRERAGDHPNHGLYTFLADGE